MLKYIAKRVLLMIPILFCVVFIVFTLSYFAPGDPVMAMLGGNFTEELYQQTRAELGLDRPFIIQFLDYVWGIITRFDFGTSFIFGHSVGNEIANRIGVTLMLGLFGVAFGVLLGIPFGLVSATKQYSVFDYGVTVMAVFLTAMPNFWMALMFILIFALNLGLVPVSGIGTWQHWILPIFVQGTTGLAVLTRMTRSSMLEVIRQDYIRTARSKGLSEGVIIRKHALKNSLMPVITVVGMQVGMIMSGSVIIETIFNIPGIGLYLIGGLTARDYPVINGTVLMLAVSICVLNLMVDLVYGFIDPRIMARYTTGKKRKQFKAKLEAEGGAH